MDVAHPKRLLAETYIGYPPDKLIGQIKPNQDMTSRVGWFCNWGLGQVGIVVNWGTDTSTKEKNEISFSPISANEFF